MLGRSMTEGAPWKHIVKFAVPVLLGSLLQQLYNTVDTIIVGNFTGEDALSAVGTTGTFTFFFLAIAIGLSAGNGVAIAQHYGAGDESEVRRNASAGIFFLMLLGAAAAIAGLITAKPVFVGIIKVPGEILDLTLDYFMIYSLGLVFQYGYNIFSSILRAVGDSSATLYFLFISSVANVLLDLLFVAVFDWGVIGAAVATDISQLGSFIAAYFYMSRKYKIFRFRLNECRWDLGVVKRTVGIGMPISLQLIVVSLGLTLIQRAVNEFGKTMTASFTVGQRIEQYINLPCNAIQTTLATYTGQNVGAGRMDRVRKGVKQAFVVSMLTTIAISTLIWTCAEPIAELFSLSDAAMEYCVPHIRTVALINIILAAYVPLFGVYQGTGHSGVPALVATCALTVRVLTVYLFRYTEFFGRSIIWWNGMFGFGIGCIVAWIYFFSGRWAINDKKPAFRA